MRFHTAKNNVQCRGERKSYYPSDCLFYFWNHLNQISQISLSHTHTFRRQSNIHSSNKCFTFMHTYTHCIHFLTRTMTNFWTFLLLRPQHNHVKKKKIKLNNFVNHKCSSVYKWENISIWFFSCLQKKILRVVFLNLCCIDRTFEYFFLFYFELTDPTEFFLHYILPIQKCRLLIPTIKLDIYKVKSCLWWCNVYRRRKWTRRHEFKSRTRQVAFYIALILLGMVWIQLFSFQLWINSRADYVLGDGN